MSYPKSLGVSFSLLATVFFVGSPGQTQPTGDVPRGVTLPMVRPRIRSHPRCALVRVNVVRGVFDQVDLRTPPAIVAAGRGYSIVWRDPGGGLFAGSLDSAFALNGTVRELARPVTSFALSAQAASGSVVAWSEPAGEIVVARLSEDNEAQNVPRVVARASGPVVALSVSGAEDGYVMVWEASSSVSGLSLDPMGVPRDRPIHLIDGALPRLSRLSPGGVLLRVEPSAVDAPPMCLSLSAHLAVTNRARWPAGAQGPVVIGDTSWFAQVNSIEQPMMLRLPVGGPMALSDPATPPVQRLEALVSTGSTAIALVTERGSPRQYLDRLMPDGSSVRLVVFRNWISGPQTLAATTEGGAVVLYRDTAAHGSRAALGILRCP